MTRFDSDRRANYIDDTTVVDENARITNRLVADAAKELRSRLSHHARVHFQIVTTLRAFSLVATVLRCEVWMLHSLQGVTYRGALQFEQRCDFMWEEETLIGSPVPSSSVPGSVPPGR